MRKKLDTRFPAARIKKIMQKDEDIGKIASAVPLLLSKALELFLQDLCNRTYDVTLERGAKTMSSLHLKQCIQSFNVFDFLRDVVKKVPDCRNPNDYDRAPKRRKAMNDDDVDSDEEMKPTKNEFTERIRGGRGRGRGRGRGACQFYCHDTPVKDSDRHYHQHLYAESLEVPSVREPEQQNTTKPSSSNPTLRDLDLNVDLDENGDTTVLASPSEIHIMNSALINEGIPVWPPSDLRRMRIDNIQMSMLQNRFDEEEDYDKEDNT